MDAETSAKNSSSGEGNVTAEMVDWFNKVGFEATMECNGDVDFEQNQMSRLFHHLLTQHWGHFSWSINAWIVPRCRVESFGKAVETELDTMEKPPIERDLLLTKIQQFCGKHDLQLSFDDDVSLDEDSDFIFSDPDEDFTAIRKYGRQTTKGSNEWRVYHRRDYHLLIGLQKDVADRKVRLEYTKHVMAPKIDGNPAPPLPAMGAPHGGIIGVNGKRIVPTTVMK